jgi:hypothetical protein
MGSPQFKYRLRFGGAALHHFDHSRACPETAFRLNSLHGRGLDWPIDYGELRRWYDRSGW